VKFIRFFLTCLATAAALGAVLVAAALLPPFQTWYARMELEEQPDLHATLGSLWARFGKVEVEDLRLEIGDAVLTLPSLEARLPIIDAIRHRRFLVGGLVAKGWTLDLSRLPDAAHERAVAALEEQNAGGAQAPAQSPAASARAAAGAFAGILTGWGLPVDASLDGVDLDGDVLVVLFPGRDPVRLHVTIKGGGVAAGREGSFAVDADTVTQESGVAPDTASFHGRLVAAMETPRTFNRVGIKADVSARSGSLHEDLAVSAGALADRAAGEETYTLDLGRGSRNLATILAVYHEAARQFDGTWKVDLQESDLARFVPGHPLPQMAAAGNGRFEANLDFTRVHLLGRLSAVSSGLGVLSPSLARTGRVTLSTRFDMVRSGRSVRVDRLDASLSGEGQAVLVQALQPFDFDEASGGVKVADPRADWLDASVKALPLAWLPALPGGLEFADGDAAGEFSVRAADGGFILRQKTPLTAPGASVRSAAGVVARGIDLSLSMTADYDAKRLEVQWAPLALDSAGRRLASIDAKGSWPAGEDQPMAISGSWKADLEALASQPNIPALAWVPGRSATCDFTGSLGSAWEVECKLAVVGRDPAHTVTATVNADVDSNGAGEIIAPVTIAVGGSPSDVSVESSWGHQRGEPRVELKLTSADVALDQLLLFAGPLAAVGGAPMRARPSAGGGTWAAPGGRDLVPFWGNWEGSLRLSFDKLRTGDQDFNDVGGTFEIEHGSIELEGGHGELPPKSLASVEGTISFDPAAEKPYSLAGTLAPVANLDSALLLPAQPGQDPVIEGHFTLAGTVTGSGANLDELLGHTQEEFQLSSSNGIVRLLTTNVADAVPEAAEPVSDSLDTVGNFVGSTLLGIKGHSIDPSKNKVNKPEEAVLNFTNQVAEIGYDKVAVTAVRGADRTIRLLDLEMVSPDAHLKGTGQIAYAKGLPVSQEPLSLDLRLGVKDVSAKLLSSVGLLSPDKDGLGYPLLNQPVRFGGSLVHIDDKQWHDLLAKAMAQKPDASKKVNTVAGH
jgi:hypothetical protein